MSAILDVDLFGDSQDTRSIAILREYEPAEGYYFANSFGKDSTVVRDLLIRSGVKFDAHHSLTTIDPPELIEFGREHHPETMIEKPERSFFQLVRDGAGLPTRKMRWCCRLLKEPGGENRRVVLGVRASESTNRKNRPIINRCARGNKTYINPIISWSSNDVWTYIKRRGIPYCSLYDEGFKRLGCVFCPFEARVNLQKSRWPKLFNALSIAVGKAYDIGKPIWLKKFQSPDDVLDWWFSRNRSMPDGGDEQMIFDQFDDD